MESNIDLKNLSKYKYAYKIYVSNGKLNSERVKLIYLSKEWTVILEGEEIKKINSNNVYLDDYLDSATKASLDFWTRYGIPKEYFIVSKRKLNSEMFNEDKKARIAILTKRIGEKRKEIERNERWIRDSQKSIEKLENQIVSMELEISELKGASND